MTNCVLVDEGTLVALETRFNDAALCKPLELKTTPCWLLQEN